MHKKTRAYNAIGAFLFLIRHDALDGQRLFENTADMGRHVPDEDIPRGWTRKTLIHRLHDVTTLNAPEEKFRKINEDFRKTLEIALRKRMASILNGSSHRHVETIVATFNDAVRNRQEEHDRNKRGGTPSLSDPRYRNEGIRADFREALKSFGTPEPIIDLMASDRKYQQIVLGFIAEKLVP